MLVMVQPGRYTVDYEASSTKEHVGTCLGFLGAALDIAGLDDSVKLEAAVLVDGARDRDSKLCLRRGWDVVY